MDDDNRGREREGVGYVRLWRLPATYLGRYSELPLSGNFSIVFPTWQLTLLDQLTALSLTRDRLKNTVNNEHTGGDGAQARAVSQRA